MSALPWKSALNHPGNRDRFTPQVPGLTVVVPIPRVPTWSSWSETVWREQLSFFLREELLVDVGAGLEEQVADPGLGGAEEGGVVGGDEGAGDAEEVLGGGLGEEAGQLLGLGFLFGGQRVLHGCLTD